MFNLFRFSGNGSGPLILIALLTRALPAAAQVTSLNMTSDPGDYVGQGQTYYLTMGNSGNSFFISAGNQNGGVSIYADTFYGQFWAMDFAAPNNAHAMYTARKRTGHSPTTKCQYMAHARRGAERSGVYRPRAASATEAASQTRAPNT